MARCNFLIEEASAALAQLLQSNDVAAIDAVLDRYTGYGEAVEEALDALKAHRAALVD